MANLTIGNRGVKVLPLGGSVDFDFLLFPRLIDLALGLSLRLYLRFVLDLIELLAAEQERLVVPSRGHHHISDQILGDNLKYYSSFDFRGLSRTVLAK